MKLLALVPLAAALAGEPQNVVSFGRDVDVPAGSSVKEVVAIGGAVTVAGDVRDSVVAIGGPARVDGRVGDDLVVIGSAELGPKASVGGELVVVGGRLTVDPAARVSGDRTAITVFNRTSRLFAWPLVWMGDYFKEGLLKLRALPPLPWAWGLALAVLLSYVLLAAAAPAAVEACRGVLERQPLQALLAGVLAVSFLGPMSLLLVVTVAGIALIPALLALLGVAAWAGKAGLLLLVGRQTAGSKFEVSAPVAVAVAGVELALLYAVPGVGLPVWALSTAWALGAGLLAALESASRETARAERAEPSAPIAAAAAPQEEADMTLHPRAGFWLRAGAVAIDAFAVAVIAGITPLLTFGLFAWAAYQIGLWTWKGTTLGGMLVGVRGVRLDGKPMDVTVAVVRHLASYLSAFACFLGFFWAAWDPEGQTWHDKLAGTVVVRTPKPQPLV
jgi:uncharacterized RDD family membrane protein YckC